MTQQDLEKLRDKLPPKWADKVAERKEDCSPAYARMVLAGTRNNIDVLNLIIEVAKEYQDELKAMQTEIAKL